MATANGAPMPHASESRTNLRATKVYCGRLALPPALEIKLDPLAFTEVAETGPLRGGNVNEHVFRPVLKLDETVAFDGIKSL